jgi:hypothetical protein
MPNASYRQDLVQNAVNHQMKELVESTTSSAARNASQFRTQP